MCCLYTKCNLNFKAHCQLSPKPLKQNNRKQPVPSEKGSMVLSKVKGYPPDKKQILKNLYP